MDWSNMGARIGRALGDVAEAAGLGERVRAPYAAQFGRCRDCDAPLGGPSPSMICQPCHAARVLARGLGGDAGGEA